MSDRLAEIKSGHLVGDDDVDWLIAEVERLEAELADLREVNQVLKKYRDEVEVLEAWQRGQIAVAVKCQKEGTECPVCFDQAARKILGEKIGECSYCNNPIQDDDAVIVKVYCSNTCYDCTDEEAYRILNDENEHLKQALDECGDA